MFFSAPTTAELGGVLDGIIIQFIQGCIGLIVLILSNYVETWRHRPEAGDQSISLSLPSQFVVTPPRTTILSPVQEAGERI